jgi:hypothetical protein
MNYNSTHFKITISGKAIFNKMNLYVIYVKDSLSYQNNPSIYDTKIAEISYLCNNAVAGTISCPWTNPSPYSIQQTNPTTQTNIFVGLTSFGGSFLIYSYINSVMGPAQY